MNIGVFRLNVDSRRLVRRETGDGVERAPQTGVNLELLVELWKMP